MPEDVEADHAPKPVAGRRLWPWAVAGCVVLAVLAWQGHHLEHLLPQLEDWLEGLGPWAPIVYVLGVALLAPLFVPDSLFGVAAGVAFGPIEGIAVYFAANVIAAVLVFVASRTFLRRPVARALERSPRLRAIERAATKDATRLSLLVRLLPFNVAMISYTLGASGIPFRAYLLGSVGMLPHLSLTVLLGAAASHVTRIAGRGREAWTTEAAATLAGLVVAWIVLGYLVRMARRALAELESDAPGDPDRPGSAAGARV